MLLGWVGGLIFQILLPKSWYSKRPQPWHGLVSPLWLCSHSRQMQGAAKSQEHCIEAGSPFCQQLCTTNLSLPLEQSRAQCYYIMSCYIICYTTTWNGEQFNVKAQSQEKLKLPGSLELQTVTATYIAYYFAQVQYLGFSNIRHLLSAYLYSHNVLQYKILTSIHTYFPILFKFIFILKINGFKM